MKKIFSRTSCKDLPNAIHSSLVKYLRKKLNLTKSTIKKNNKKKANFLVCNRTKTHKIKINLLMIKVKIQKNMSKKKMLIKVISNIIKRYYNQMKTWFKIKKLQWTILTEPKLMNHKQMKVTCKTEILNWLYRKISTILYKMWALFL